jgi:hypothetical protein
VKTPSPMPMKRNDKVHHPTCLNALLNPTSPSILSRKLAPADADRCLGFNIGTSSNPLARDVLRLLFPTIIAISCAVGGTKDDEREEGGESVDEFEMVGTREGDMICLCMRIGVLSF